MTDWKKNMMKSFKKRKLKTKQKYPYDHTMHGGMAWRVHIVQIFKVDCWQCKMWCGNKLDFFCQQIHHLDFIVNIPKFKNQNNPTRQSITASFSLGISTNHNARYDYRLQIQNIDTVFERKSKDKKFWWHSSQVNVQILLFTLLFCAINSVKYYWSIQEYYCLKRWAIWTHSRR